MSEKKPWAISLETESLSVAEELLQAIPWNEAPKKPLDLVIFLNKLHKIWPFNFISLNGDNYLRLKVRGENLNYRDIFEFILDEIELPGNEIENVDISPRGFNLLILKNNDDLSFATISIYRDSHILIDLHIFEKKSIYANFEKLTLC
jgi:hypothetical protein